MKAILTAMILLLSFNSFSHCGACGEGEAKDHHEKGEDASHHDNDKEYGEKDKESKDKDSESAD